MQTINVTDTATAMVEKLNANFIETSQTGAATPRTIRMQLQGGVLVNGYTGYTSTDSVFMRNCHTVLMLGIENCIITGVGLDEGQTLTIHCFDENGAFMQSVNSIEDLDSDVYYVKFQLTQSTDFVYLNTLSVTVLGKPTLRKNSVPSLVAKKTFSYETTYPAYFDTDNNSESETLESGASGYLGSNSSVRYYDNAFIELPPNYDPEGAPVPLVVYVHGTDGWSSFANGPSTTYASLMDFIVNNGYALCDCIGLTNLHKSMSSTTSKGNDAFYAPSFISCINEMVKFIGANYNVDTNGVYIYGKSSGGFTLHALTQLQGLRIRAAGSLAPGVSVIGNLNYNLWDEMAALNTVCSQIGATQMQSSWRVQNDVNADFLQAILGDIHKWRNIDPLFMGADLSDDEVYTLTQQVYSDDNAKFGISSSSRTKRDFSKASLCVEKLDTAKIHISVPTKIWISSDDTQVPYGTAELFVEMAQRAGSPVYMRRMPNNTGSHHSVDTDSKAPKVTYQTKYGGSVSIPVAYAELVDWFNRF